MTSNGQKLLTSQELADLLNLPSASVRRYAREGRLPCFRIGRLLRFNVDEVLTTVKEGERRASSTTMSNKS